MKNDNTRNIRGRYQLDTYAGIKAYAKSRPNGIRKVSGTGVQCDTWIYSAHDEYGDYCAIKLIETEIYRHYANGIQVVSPRGYHTVTTLRRIKIGLTHGWSLYTKKDVTYAAHSSGTQYVLHDSLVLMPNGIAGRSLDVAHTIIAIESADQLDSIDRPADERPVMLINIDYELDSTWEFIGNGIERADYDGALFVWSEPGDHMAIWAVESLYNVMWNEPLTLVYMA